MYHAAGARRVAALATAGTAHISCSHPIMVYDAYGALCRGPPSAGAAVATPSGSLTLWALRTPMQFFHSSAVALVTAVSPGSTTSGSTTTPKRRCITKARHVRQKATESTAAPHNAAEAPTASASAPSMDPVSRPQKKRARASRSSSTVASAEPSPPVAQAPLDTPCQYSGSTVDEVDENDVRSNEDAGAQHHGDLYGDSTELAVGEASGYGGSDHHDSTVVDDGDIADDAVTGTNLGEAEQVERAAEVREETDYSAVDGEIASALPCIGNLLDFESPLNLRLATLTRQHGKAFRAIAVYLPDTRTTMNFDITFEDIASGARLVCKLDEIKSRYVEWISLFCASFIAVFVPTLQSPSVVLLQNAIGSSRPARPPPPAGSYHPRLNEDPDHLFFSYTKLREVISHKKKDKALNPKLLTMAVLNAYAEEWKNFISAPLSCAPQAFLLAAFNFQSHSGDINAGAMLNKELLQAQLAAAADAIVLYSSTNGSQATRRRTGAVATSLSATSTGLLRNESDRWGLIFVSAPARTAVGTAAIPPMQDLLTGQFVQPLSLSERHLIYIIGTGSAAESFARFPLARKGNCAFSILLQDVESQLGLERPHRLNLTSMLTQALDSFSRITWMGLMKEENGEPHMPHPSSAFYRLQRRSVQREIMPSFLEPVFAPGPRFMGGGAGGRTVDSMGRPIRGGTPDVAVGRGGTLARDLRATAQASRLLEEHIQVIYNSQERLSREKALQEAMRSRVAYFMHVTSASVTAARRADNPFSARNGMIDVLGQLWTSLSLMNPPTVRHWQASIEDKTGEVKKFVDPEVVLPDTLPIGPPEAPNPKDRAENAILIGWDIKRILLFLRRSVRLRTFLYNGGKVWCAQYAQYLLKGFNNLHLATMERTLLQYHDGPLKGSMQPLAKLKLIYEMQLEVAVSTRQMSSVQHRMDGLLASMEMELQGLQLAPQSQVTYFANTLRLDHERLEKVLHQKIMDFTQSMDDDVRQRINFRSPQDISTIIYGGGLCRHLGSRFIPVKPTRYPVTSLFPHAVCYVTGTNVPDAYMQVDTLLGGNSGVGSGGQNSGSVITMNDAQRSLQTIQQLCKRCSMDALIQQTAVVVVLCKVKIGGWLEQISLYCPAATGPETREINLRVAVDDVIPVAERPDVVTVTQLKECIGAYEPLKQLLAASSAASTGASRAPTARKPSGKKTRQDGKVGGDGEAAADLRNILILTNCAHDKLETLVDTGVLEAIKKAVFDGHTDGGGPASLERVCFADVNKAFPPPPQGADSFESDFSELTSSNVITFSARCTWEVHAKELVSLGGVEGAVKSIVSQCASVLGTPRDAFRSSQPTPSSAPQGLHGQEQASTAGMLWMVTPEKLHPLLRRFLRGKSASSGADAMERVTTLLSPYKTVDLSFFSALQQLRFTEKKLQLFEEGCLFRAVLPECHDRVHGELCHCVTATGRLSSQSPNLQNIPKEEDLRRLIVSRFGAQGMMIEADYSQLEVVVLAALCRDPRMMQELRDNVDFHCLRVSLMTKEPYEDVVRKAKVKKDPQYIQLRQQAKVFSFQRQYGAGISTISTTTGLTEQEVDRLIVAEEHHYKELSKYYSLVTRCVEAGADRLLRLRTLDTSCWNTNIRRVVMLTEPMYYFVVPTGSKFDFTRDRKSVPRLKNYPVQGLAGEIVQIMCGAIVREFYQKRNYGEKAFLVNTVHDCVWVDAHKSVADEVRADLARIMGHTQETIATLWPDMKLDVPFKVEIHSGSSLGELSA
ncbi:mitochondrial DNA polymerase I protein C, putative [Leishmania guyanensis]|uniref:Mitochondrial DNA polymerase I protein C,putative n=1 Tax=Leishmania guyanensis TaxID=5670 RepID=A0A1E1IRP8_LEIGU|nr:mitochondrial DNA polymerase I protein C,putative [Leishmania guyanensis]